jgi:hypothetical protein
MIFSIILLTSCLSDKSNNIEFCLCNNTNIQFVHSLVHEINELRLNIPPNNTHDFKNHINNIDITFKKVADRKKFILPLLLCFQDDEGFSLYHKVPFSSNHLGHAAIPNYIHSLYLFESIIRNDIFFNRGKTNIYLRRATAVEYINTIIDTSAPPSYLDSIKFPFTPTRIDKYFNHYYFNVDFSEYKQMYDEIWFLYAFWLIENYEKVYYETFPLDGTKYRWGTFYEDGLKIKKKEPKSTNIH